MERDVMDIIKEKEFIELTPNERAELRDLCSTEDEFNQMKNLFAGMEAVSWSNPAPRAETKQSLDALFQQKYPKAAPIWYNGALTVIAPREKPFYRQPLIQVAAIGLLFLLAYPLVNSNSMDDKVNQVAVIENKKSVVKPLVEEKSEEETLPSREANEQIINDESALRNASPELVLEHSTTTSRALPSDVPAATPMHTSAGLEGTIASAGSASQPGSNHPDGIFIEDRAQVFSVPASRQPAVFDLLTSTF